MSMITYKYVCMIFYIYLYIYTHISEFVYHMSFKGWLVCLWHLSEK